MLLVFLYNSIEDGLERFVGTLETDSGLLQMLPNFFAVCGEAVSGRTPLVEGGVETLAANADPVCLEHSGIVLNLGLELCGDLLIKLDEEMSELAHRIGIDVNSSH